MNRLEAHAAGAKTYSAVRPCLNGHMSKRYVASGNCVECAQRFKTVKPRRVIVPEHLGAAFDAMCAALGVTQLQPGDPEQALSTTPLHDPHATFVHPFQRELDQLKPKPAPEPLTQEAIDQMRAMGLMT